MAILFPDEGRKLALDILLRSTVPPKIRLFQNNLVPDPDDVMGSFLEADFSGYVAQDLAFGVPIINDSDQGQVHQDDITFTHDATEDAGNTIYGWYITTKDPGGTERLLFYEKFDVSVVVHLEDDRVRFDLRLFDQLAAP